MKFFVEHLFLYGWDDAGWTSDDKPLRFNDAEAAQAEIEDHCRMATEAGMSDYRPEHYRVRRVK